MILAHFRYEEFGEGMTLLGDHNRMNHQWSSGEDSDIQQHYCPEER